MGAEETFQAIASDAAKERQGYVYRRVLPGSKFDVRLEVAVSSNRRRLCVHSSTVSASTMLMLTKGFIAQVSPDEGVFRLELQDSRLQELFSALVDDFISALQRADSCGDPIHVLLERVALWQRLFEEPSLTGLSEDSQRGLFAELRFLQEVQLPAIGPVAAVASWKAPNRWSKDFVHGSLAIEVKSRFKRAEPKVRISSEHQLDQEGYDLYLAVVSLGTEDQGGETLPELVQRIRKDLAVSATAMARFDDQLILMGYLEVHADLYRTYRYTSASSYFQVRSEFPRIVPYDICQGVSRVSYDLDLGSLAPYSVGVEMLRTKLGGLNV